MPHYGQKLYSVSLQLTVSLSAASLRNGSPNLGDSPSAQVSGPGGNELALSNR